jgi:hypothetical protein
MLLLVVGAAARAQQVNGVTVEGSNIARYDAGREVDTRQAAFDYPDNTMARRFFENRLQLDVYYRSLRAGGRLLYFRPSAGDQYRDGLTNESRIDKRFLEATLDPLIIRAGHFSDMWGHGLAFSATENRDLYFDSELDGVHAKLDFGPLSAVAFRGTSQEGRLVHQAELTGARVGSQFGGQSLAYNYLFIEEGAYPEFHVSSLDWRVSSGPLTLIGERAWDEAVLPRKPQRGHATYVGLQMSLIGWSLALDYKDYDYHVVTPFQNPATVYREVGPRLLQGRYPHVLNTEDEVGYQGELAGHLTQTTYTTFHYSLSSHHDRSQDFVPVPTLKEKNAPYWEMFASVEQDLPHDRDLYVEVGGNEETVVEWQQRKWLWLRFSMPCGWKQQLDVESESLLITSRTRDDQKFVDQLFSLEWESGRGVSLTAQYVFTNDDALKHQEGRGWPSVEGGFNLGEGRHRLLVFYGRERGGLRCSNGVCRQVQAFSGLRLTLESTL